MMNRNYFVWRGHHRVTVAIVIIMSVVGLFLLFMHLFLLDLRSFQVEYHQSTLIATNATTTTTVDATTIDRSSHMKPERSNDSSNPHTYQSHRVRRDPPTSSIQTTTSSSISHQVGGGAGSGFSKRYSRSSPFLPGYKPTGGKLPYDHSDFL